MDAFIHTTIWVLKDCGYSGRKMQCHWNDGILGQLDERKHSTNGITLDPSYGAMPHSATKSLVTKSHNIT